jgi:hypothetical protein
MAPPTSSPGEAIGGTCVSTHPNARRFLKCSRYWPASHLPGSDSTAIFRLKDPEPYRHDQDEHRGIFMPKGEPAALTRCMAEHASSLSCSKGEPDSQLNPPIVRLPSETARAAAAETGVDRGGL